MTPNWRFSNGIFPTDTTRPPVSNPLEWQYVAQDAEIRAAGDAIEILDEYRADRSLQEFAEAIIRSDADVFVLSTAPSYLFWRCPPTSLDLPSRYARCIAESRPDAQTIIVGPHGTADPQSTLSLVGARYVFRGEVDHRLLDTIAALRNEQLPPHLATSERDGVPAPELPFRSDGLTYCPSDVAGNAPHTWLPSAVEDIRSRTSGFALLETSRGCSYDCPYCFRAGFRRNLRLKPLSAVADELDQLVAFGVGYVYLIDETFGLPRSHATGVMALLKERGIEFGIQTRPDIWTEATLEDLRDSGCVYAELGTETLTRAGMVALEKFNNGERALALSNLFREKISHVGVNIVDVGNPDLELMPTAAARQERDNEGRRPPAFIPYPGTPWGDRALARAGVGTGWEDVDALHAVYDRAAREGALAALLRRSRRSRRVMHSLAITAKRLHVAARGLSTTRFERGLR